MKRRGEPQRQASGGEGSRALPPGASTPSPGGGHFYFGQTPDISTLRGHRRQPRHSTKTPSNP